MKAKECFTGKIKALKFKDTNLSEKPLESNFSGSGHKKSSNQSWLLL